MTAGDDMVLGTPDDKASGRVWGPYIQPDKIKFGNPDGPANTDFALYAFQYTLLDRQGNPILYFPANPRKPTISSANGYVAASTSALYNFDHNESVKRMVPDNELKVFETAPGDPSDANRLRRMQVMLGDADKDGQIGPGETARITGPYVLWSAGNDEIYGPYPADPARRTNPDRRDADACDDILSPLP